MRGPETVYLAIPMGTAVFASSASCLGNGRPLKRTGLAALLVCIGFGLSLLLRNEGITGNYRALQPHVIGDDTVLLPTGMNTGTRAIRVTRREGKLVAEEL